MEEHVKANGLFIIILNLLLLIFRIFFNIPRHFEITIAWTSNILFGHNVSRIFEMLLASSSCNYQVMTFLNSISYADALRAIKVLYKCKDLWESWVKTSLFVSVILYAVYYYVVSKRLCYVMKVWFITVVTNWGGIAHRWASKRSMGTVLIHGKFGGGEDQFLRPWTIFPRTRSQVWLILKIIEHLFRQMSFNPILQCYIVQ